MTAADASKAAADWTTETIASVMPDVEVNNRLIEWTIYGVALTLYGLIVLTVGLMVGLFNVCTYQHVNRSGNKYGRGWWR